MSYKLSKVLENSLAEMGTSLQDYTAITESKDGASNSIDSFASMIGKMIEEKYKTSLAYEICDVQPLTTSTGSIFTFKKVLVSGTKYKFTVTKTPVETVSKPVNTGFTTEAWEDMKAQYGKDANDVCASIFGSISGSNETTDLMTLVKANALALPSGASTDNDEVFERIGEAIVKINQKTFHSMDAWVIAPASIAGYMLLNPNHFLSDSLDTISTHLVYKFGRTKIFINPDSTDLNCYVGVNAKDPGHSSVIFSPYQYISSTAVDVDTGNTNVFLFNRYALTVNPLHVAGNEMLYKFAVN